MKIILLWLSLATIAGCASTSASPTAQDCLDARRSVELVAVKSPMSVLVRQPPAREYRVMLAEPCAALSQRSITVSLANGMSQPIHRPGRPSLWATQIHGSGRVCGGGFDRLLVRSFGDDLTMPPRSCAIRSVERLSR